MHPTANRRTTNPVRLTRPPIITSPEQPPPSEYDFRTICSHDGQFDSTSDGQFVMTHPHQSALEPGASSPEDPRLGELIGRSETDVVEGSLVLIGFPTDEGVRRNGGRAGSAKAPATIREQLFRLTPDPRIFNRHIEVLRKIVDLGDIGTTSDLEADQQRLGTVVRGILRRGAIPIIFGGGHETAYGHYLGYADGDNSTSIINWDAHTDVRPLRDGQAHSGSPFRQAIEHPTQPCRRYLVAGLQPASVAHDHLAFVDAHGGRAWFARDIDQHIIDRIYGLIDSDAMVTFDLDAVAEADAPGVSAPAVDGLSVRHWLYAARRAGENSTIKSFDICELNPRLDVDGRTARLAARTVWEFIRGVVDRQD